MKQIKAIRNFSRIIPKAVVFGGLTCAAASCSPCRAVQQTMQQVTANTEKTVEYIERVRDTIVYATLPAESRLSAIKTDSSFLETSAARSDARILGDGTLYHTLENKPVALPAKVTVKDKEITVIENKEKESRAEVQTPVRLPLRGWEKFLVYCGLLFLGTVVAAAAILLIRISK